MTLKQLIDLHGFGKWFKHNADTNYEFMPLRFSSIRPHWIIGEINQGYNPATCFSENDEGWELKEEFKLDPAKFTWASSFGSVGGGPGGGGVGNKEEPKPIRIELPQNPIPEIRNDAYITPVNIGISRRDFLAGMVMQGFVVTEPHEPPEYLSKISVEAADALIKELDKKCP